MLEMTEKEIEEMKAKTYTYLSTVLSGFFGALILLRGGTFVFDMKEYMIYHNNDSDDPKGHYVDLNEMWFCGIVAIIACIFMILVIHCQSGKIKQIEKKTPVIIITVILDILFTSICGFLIMCLWK